MGGLQLGDPPKQLFGFDALAGLGQGVVKLRDDHRGGGVQVDAQLDALDLERGDGVVLLELFVHTGRLVVRLLLDGNQPASCHLPFKGLLHLRGVEARDRDTFG